MNPPDIASIVKDEGHGGHTGPIWGPGLKDAKIVWGDIIPSFDYELGIPGDKHAGHYPGMNWTAFGQAIYNNNCELPTNVATSISTVVFNASTNAAWAGTEQEGASAYDTSTLSWPATFPVPTGTVTYTFFTNNTCGATGTSAGEKALTGTGSVPNSNPQSDLATGLYSFKATYNGAGMFNKSESLCEPFTVKAPPSEKTDTTTTTKVFDETADDFVAAGGTVGLNDVVHDTATVGTKVGDNVIGGTVTYYFFNTNSCPSDGKTGALSNSPQAMTGGTVPKSSSQGPLAAGNYAYDAVYSGDDHYNGSISACEPFTIEEGGPPEPGTSSIATTVFDNATGTAVTGLEKAGVTVYDTSKVTVASGTPEGTVSYTFFTNNSCTGTGTAAGTVTLDANGNVPISNKQASLTQGWYSFKAAFTSTDSNVTGSTSACEPFDVDPGGAVLAATGMTTSIQSLALALMASGLIAMAAAFAWRRREA